MITGWGKETEIMGHTIEALNLCFQIFVIYFDSLLFLKTSIYIVGTYCGTNIYKTLVCFYCPIV